MWLSPFRRLTLCHYRIAYSQGVRRDCGLNAPPVAIYRQNNMGRYYSGDIEGKFWFAVQASDDASFFGGEQSEPNYINYYFDEGNKEEIAEGIEKCNLGLGKYKEGIEKFFNTHDCYNDEQIMKDLKITKEKVKELLTWYARLELGLKIQKCVEDNGQCHFEAEC